MNIAILINKVSENALPDELDVFEQVEVVEKALKELGHKTERIFIDMDLKEAENKILDAKADFIFNLFEGIKGKTDMLYIAAALLDNLQIPYSGCPTNAIFITADKVLTKKILKSNNLPTAEWFELKESSRLKEGKKYILKPRNEDASVGIFSKNVFTAPNIELIEEYKKYGNKYFIEEFIEGREFNISILGTAKGAQMLKPAEMIFDNYPEHLPKILSYEAKWIEDTFEFDKSYRSFDLKPDDNKLVEKIEHIVLKCWEIFDLRGYARIDFRVDKENNPVVLEINANPCISENAGFYNSAKQSGLNFNEVISYILNDTLKDYAK